jgi:hypothetical protein
MKRKNILSFILVIIVFTLAFFSLKTSNAPKTDETKIYSKYGFSIEIPKDYNPVEQEAEGGPSVLIYLPNDSVIFATSQFSWWEKYEIPNWKYVKDEKIGENIFQVYKDEYGNIFYLLRNGNEGYRFEGDKSQLTTFKISNMALLPDRYVSAQAGWPPVIQLSSDKYSCIVGDSEMKITREALINKKMYCITIFSEGAAGSRYNTYTYTTAFLGGIKTTSFTLRYTNCGVYFEPEKAECERVQSNFDLSLNAIIDNLMQ